MNLDDEHIGVCIFFIYDENRGTETVLTFHTHPAVTAEATKHNKICKGCVKRQNNNKKHFSILMDSDFYEPIMILKSQSMLFSADECTVHIAHPIQ